MLIEWMKDSVVNCFAKSCKLVEKIEHVAHKPVIQQQVHRPKLPSNAVKYAVTEIRATENPRGGLAYEVILTPAVKDSASAEPAPSGPNNAPKSKAQGAKCNLSVDAIAEKLKAAEKRRQMLDAKKQQLGLKMRMRTEEVNAKKSASMQLFVDERREILEKKLAIAAENRDAHIQSKIDKLKEHEENIMKARRQIEEKMEERQQELGIRIERKLELVNENREQMLQRKIEALKEHDRRVAEIRHLKALSANQSSG